MNGVCCLCLGEEEYIRIPFSLSCYDCRAVRECVQLSLTFLLAEFIFVFVCCFQGLLDLIAADTLFSSTVIVLPTHKKFGRSCGFLPSHRSFSHSFI